MASPFNVFRKNQRIMMAVLIGLSMFAFIVADSINASNAPIFLGAILGAAGLWLLSNKGGNEGWLIAAVGGLVGGIIGAFAPGWLGRDTAVYTTAGNLTNQEIVEIQEEQQVANQFLQGAFLRIAERTPEEERMALRRPVPFQFVQVTDQASAQENAALTYLFGEKADEMGITLTDEAVQQFIVEAINGKLTKSELREVRSQLRVGTGELLDILREQLQAREAYRLLSPVGSAGLGPSTPTPQQLWNDFKKLKEEATAAVATLPVQEFVSEVEDPSTDELRRFFELHKAQNPAPDGTPGFRVPRKVQVAYLEILASKVRENVTPPTEEEVLAHYEANKARYEFSQQMPGALGTQTAPATREPIEAPRPGADASSAAPMEDPMTDDPAAGDTPEITPMPADETAPEPSSDEGTAPIEAAKPPGESGAGIARDGMTFVSFQAEAPKPDNAPTAEDAKPANNPVGDSKPEIPAEEPTEDPATPAGPALPDVPAMDAPANQDVNGAEPKAAAGPSEQTLATIRQELMTQRTREALNARQVELREQVDLILQEVMTGIPLPTDPQDEKQIAEYETARTAAVKQVRERLDQLAQKHADVEYRLTPTLSYEELTTSEEYPVGQSMRWRENQPAFGPDSAMVADLLFQSAPDQPLLPINAQSILNESRYVLLKAADLPTRVPEFSDEGVEEQVEQAWKIIEARKLAEERATELVKSINDSKAGFAELSEGQTVSGQKPGEPLTVEELGPFTWMQRSSVPSQGMAMPAIQQTSLPELPAAGEEFMETVFETTGVGKAGMAPSVDGESFYVVQVKSRTPEKELEAARNEFLGEDFFSDQMNFFTGMSMNPYRQHAINDAINVRQDWLRGFLEQHEYLPAGQATP